MNKFESSSITRKFQNQKQAHLSDPDIRVVAGVSGGPDSMAMLYLLHRFDIKTVVVHCNYQLRGDASDKDQELVENMCVHWNIECVSVRFDTKGESHGNFQDWARKRRYLAFHDIKNEYKADLILTAHHQDDQVETILQKILRGAGIASWKGMEVRDGDLFRPFLNVSKLEIMEFVQNFNVPYRIDSSNEESTYARNFIRKHWFPDLNRLFPGWKENLRKLTERAEEFHLMSEWILDRISEDERTLNRKKFLELHPKIKPAILLQFIKKSGIETDISYGFLDNADELGELQSGGKLQLSREYFILRDRQSFKLTDESETVQFHREIEKKPLENPHRIGKWEFYIEQVPGQFSAALLHLDLHQLKFPLTLRTWKPGDAFQPLGMDGTQLVSDHLTNRKIPSSVKKKALVLESFDTTISAVIFPVYPKVAEIGTISETVRCTSATTKILTIRKIEQNGFISA